MTVVVLGAGHGGVQVAASLRSEGHRGPVVLLDAQEHLPYHRPQLSKEYLGPGAGQPQLLRSASFFADQDIDLRLGTAAVALHPARRRVELHDGGALAYTHLVLALGSTLRRLRVPGGHLDGVTQAATLADAAALRERLGTARDVVVVGGGFLGLEIAAACAGSGLPVTVVEPQDRLLARAVTPAVSAAVRRTHEAAGTVLRLGVGVASFTGRDGRVRGVVLSDGAELPADLVVVAVGAVANSGIAAAAGLAVDNGVLVDPWLRSSVPEIVAVGDCVARPDRELGAPRRIECVQNAIDQARHVASSITHGPGEPYDRTPWFWTHQLGLRVQTVGLGFPGDECVVVGDPDGDGFSVCRFHRGRLVAVESVNRPRDHMAARRLLAGGVLPGPAAVRSAGFDLKEHELATRGAA
ncbi:NAD(P)/FAD-dependent oxidoreductase [Pseudonocardia broussonetiae]|uniref:FAD-dependent oxidoreductase n=1 Tax=Pseudonocardia broussonetiae TaxID=2736640 RepID=A0A6M6JER8_9PSEU|nr:FAD-dependent oxidoreductase [Pseudonocardia broussonetiae]QJY46076.1 FAD-dependent oxidoreductase [Pseudonocardia broussonetiae]